MLSTVKFAKLLPSAIPLIVEFESDELAIFDKVFEAPLIVLLVKVSVVALPTTVSDAFCKVHVLAAVGSTTVKVVS